MPTVTTVLALQAYGPGTFLFGNPVPVPIASTLTGYRIEVTRVNFQDPTTAILIWLDLSIDGGLTWLGFPIPQEIYDTLGMTAPGSPINAFSSAGDRGRADYPIFLPASKGGAEQPAFIFNPNVPGAGLSTRVVRGGALVKGTVTTSMKLTTFP